MVIPKGKIITTRDVMDRKSVNEVQDILHDEVFQKYFSHKKLLDIVESFVGPNIVAVNSMLVAQPPDVGAGISR